MISTIEALLIFFYEWKKGEGNPRVLRTRSAWKLTNSTHSAADNGRSAQLTGKVWEKCNAVERLPLDNNTAACNAIRNWMLAIKGKMSCHRPGLGLLTKCDMIADAMHELSELAEKEPKTEDVADENEKDEEEDEAQHAALGTID